MSFLFRVRNIFVGVDGHGSRFVARGQVLLGQRGRERKNAFGAGRLSVFSMHFAIVGKRFGHANFGTLAGVELMTSTIVSLMQRPLIVLTSNRNVSAVNMVCGSVLLGLLPCCVWSDQRERAGIGAA
jgi:hypothetical protein